MKTLKCATCANCGEELNSVVGVNCAECVESFKIMDAKKLERESKLNNGKAMKLNIKDLAYYSNMLAIGSSILEDVSDDGDLFGEFAGHGLSFENIEYLAKQSEKEERTVLEAKAILKSNKKSFDESWSDEAIILFAEQFLDSSSHTTGKSYYKDEGVTVTVQKLSTNGRWFNLKDLDDNKITFHYDTDTLFEKSKGSISGLKMKEGTVKKAIKGKMVDVVVTMPVVIADMKALGFIVDGYSGRVLLSSVDFRKGAMIDSHILEEVPAKFKLGYVDGEVTSKETNYVWDEKVLTHMNKTTTAIGILEVFPGIAILPSDRDTTQAQADETEHNDNILIGMSIITPQMSSYFTALAERNKDIALEEELELIAIRTRIPAAIKAEKHKIVMSSDAGAVADLICKVSWENGYDAMELFNENKHMGEEILAAMKSIKYAFVQGESKEDKKTKGCQYKVYKDIEKLVMQPKVDAALAAIEVHIVENIIALNNNEIYISDLTDEEAVEILDTAIKNMRLIPATKITNQAAYSELSARVKKIKFSNDVAAAKARVA